MDWFADAFAAVASGALDWAFGSAGVLIHPNGREDAVTIRMQSESVDASRPGGQGTIQAAQRTELVAWISIASQAVAVEERARLTIGGETYVITRIMENDGAEVKVQLGRGKVSVIASPGYLRSSQ